MEYWHTSQYKLCSAWVFFVALDVFFGVTKGTSHDEINKHLAMGGEMLARGQLQDALSHYHAAVEGDPGNYLTYFKRGTVYLALGKPKMAIADFNKVLELKPDFTGARLQRAHIYLKQGSLAEARDDFFFVAERERDNDALQYHTTASDLEGDFARAEDYVRHGSYINAVDLLNQLIEICPWSSHLRSLRAECHIALGSPTSAILDLRSTTKLESDNTDGYFKLALLHYKLGQTYESLREIRECLKLDPEHKSCFPHYKKVKKIEKFLTDAREAIESNDFDTCIDAANKVLRNEDSVPMIKFLGKEKLCHCYLNSDRTDEALTECSEALEIHKDPEVLCDRAEAYINNEMFDKAIKDYQEVLEIQEDHHRAKEGIQRAQNLQKQSEKRDYYKILGVKRTASKKEIIKAYRKAAQKWHPDNFPTEGEEKKRAEKKFIDIAAAKEVLTDPEKRQKFDKGVDPLDPESGQHPRGFNPFQSFHHFHQGEPFTFKFHFN